MQALGATPVAMPKSDEYDALQKGVVDGTVGGHVGDPAGPPGRLLPDRGRDRLTVRDTGVGTRLL